MHISGVKFNTKESESLHGNLIKVGIQTNGNEGKRGRCGTRKDGLQMNSPQLGEIRWKSRGTVRVQKKGRKSGHGTDVS